MLCQCGEIYLFDRRTGRSSSIGDDNIDRPVRLARRTRHGDAIGFLGHVGDNRRRFGKARGYIFQRRLASSGQRNSGTLARQRTRDRSADAGAAAGDQMRARLSSTPIRLSPSLCRGAT